MPMKGGISIEMPEDGILTDRGIPFYHMGIHGLTQQMKDRIHSCGINLAINKHFTTEEDLIIRQNWINFSKKLNIPYDDALLFSGYKGSEEDSMSRIPRLLLCKRHNFWPNMCRNLLERSAKQVKDRMIQIFQPGFRFDETIRKLRFTPWTEEEKERFEKLYVEYGKDDLKYIAQCLNRPFPMCYNYCRNLFRYESKIVRNSYRKLWNIIEHIMSKKDVHLKKVVKEAVRQGDENALESLHSTIDWRQVATRMNRSENVCMRTWKRIVKELFKTYNQEIVEPEVNRKVAWSRTFKQVLVPPPGVTCADFCKFIRIIEKLAPFGKDFRFDPLSKHDYCKINVSEKLLEAGVTGFNSGMVSEYTYLFMRLQKILLKLTKLFFDRLEFRYSLTDKLRILRRAYQRREREVLRNKWAVHPLTLPTVFVVEALILYSCKHFEDWTPPAKLKKYVQSDEVLALFSEEKNNEEMLSERKKKRRYDMIIGDYDIPVDSEADDTDFFL